MLFLLYSIMIFVTLFKLSRSDWFYDRREMDDILVMFFLSVFWPIAVAIWFTRKLVLLFDGV